MVSALVRRNPVPGHLSAASALPRRRRSAGARARLPRRNGDTVCPRTRRLVLGGLAPRGVSRSRFLRGATVLGGLAHVPVRAGGPRRHGRIFRGATAGHPGALRRRTACGVAFPAAHRSGADLHRCREAPAVGLCCRCARTRGRGSQQLDRRVRAGPRDRSAGIQSAHVHVAENCRARRLGIRVRMPLGDTFDGRDNSRQRAAGGRTLRTESAARCRVRGHVSPSRAHRVAANTLCDPIPLRRGVYPSRCLLVSASPDSTIAAISPRNGHGVLARRRTTRAATAPPRGSSP